MLSSSTLIILYISLSLAQTEEDRQSALLAEEYGHSLPKLEMQDAQASGLSLRKWQKKYRLVATFDFADASAEALKVGSGSSASGATSFTSSQSAISFHIGIRPTQCLEV